MPSLATNTGESVVNFLVQIVHIRSCSNIKALHQVEQIALGFSNVLITVTHDHHGVSNYWQNDCLAKYLFILTTDKTPTLRYVVFVWGNPPAQTDSLKKANAKRISMPWRHHIMDTNDKANPDESSHTIRKKHPTTFLFTVHRTKATMRFPVLKCPLKIKRPLKWDRFPHTEIAS